MWFLAVAVLTGSTLPGGTRDHPLKTEVFMERNFSTEEGCKRAAERYKALEKFSVPGRRVHVDVACILQP